MSETGDVPAVPSFQGTDLEVIRRYLDARDTEITRLDRIESATERLTAEVGALTSALERYATKGQVDNIHEVLARHDRKFEARAQELLAMRLRVRRRTNIMFGVTLVLVLLAGVTSAFFFQREAGLRRELCVDRNVALIDQARDTRAYFAPKLAEATAHHSDPVLISILRELSNAEPKLVSCG